MKRVAAVVGILLALYLDSIFFARLNIYGVRPDVMLAMTISFGVHTGMLSGGITGGIGGLLMDILFGRMLGLNAALYLLAGLAGGFFYQKFYADNVIVPGVTALVAGLVKDLLYALLLAVTGARFSLGWMLVQYILPAAVFTAAVCMLAHLCFKPMVGRQVSHGRGFER